jgi:hypothetical protein
VELKYDFGQMIKQKCIPGGRTRVFQPSLSQVVLLCVRLLMSPCTDSSSSSSLYVIKEFGTSRRIIMDCRRPSLVRSAERS